jgi:ferrous iron transport protein A
LILNHRHRDRVTLDALPTGTPARVESVDARSPVMLRLMEMGLVPGSPVTVQKRAPFGGPLQLRVRGYLLSLRRAEARGITVAACGGSVA